jgi:hypothetical protein
MPQRFNLYLDDTQATLLRQLSARLGISMSALLRVAINGLAAHPEIFLPYFLSDTHSRLATLLARDAEQGE